jgi:hypothetical protein
LFCNKFIGPLVLLSVMVHVDLSSQDLLMQKGSNPFKNDTNWKGFVIKEIIETIEVDPIEHALPSSPGSDCNGNIVQSSQLSPGRYVVGITGGPGIKYSGLPPALYSVAVTLWGHFYAGFI